MAVRRVRARICVAGITAGFLLAGCAAPSQSAPSLRYPNGHQFVLSELAASTRLPAGSTLVTTGIPGVLHAWEQPPNLDNAGIRVGHVYDVPLPVGLAVRFVRSHVRAGEQVGPFGRFFKDGRIADTFDITVPTTAPDVGSASVTVSALTVTAHRSLVRLDAQSEWFPPQKPIDQIPRTGIMTLTRFTNAGGASDWWDYPSAELTLTTLQADAVRRVFHDLPLNTTGASCGFGYPAEFYTVVVRPVAGAPPTYVATGPGCGGAVYVHVAGLRLFLEDVHNVLPRLMRGLAPLPTPHDP